MEIRMGISQKLNILVVDDEINIRKTLAYCLEIDGHSVCAVGGIDDALVEASSRAFDLAFIDLRLGSVNGLDLIPALREGSPWIKCVIITAYASIGTAVESMRSGAFDYITKPFEPAQVRLVCDKVAGIRALELKLEALQADLTLFNPELNFATDNNAMKRAIETGQQAAGSEATVLLCGESGTGKSVLARAIHSWSARSSKPMKIVSCPTLSPELLESELFGHARGAFTGAVRENLGRIAACNGGTLFLDEIGDLPLSIQPKLLRFIQDREYERVGENITRKADVRIIAATNTDLKQAMLGGRFREDLYYRLNVIQIVLPPLRDRPEDLEQLASDFLFFFGRVNHKLFKGFTREALAALKSYSWPGNMRELRNVVERAAILCHKEWIGPEDLPESFKSDIQLLRPGDSVSLEKIKEAHIRRLLARTRSFQEAADILGIDQATLWRYRKSYGI